MKAIFYSAPGDTSVIEMKEVADPVPTQGQLVIEIKAFALNRADILQRKGHYPPPKGESQIPGLEAAGVVLRNESANPRFPVGTRVMTLLAAGGYAQKVCVDERLAMAVPESLSFEEAAAIPEAFLTAHHNLFTLGQVKTYERVLVHAGASGVGTAAIQLLNYQSAQVFATVGSPEKAAFLTDRWTLTPLEYKKTDFADAVLQATAHHGVDLILDCIGASYLTQNLKALALQGRIVCIGTMGGAKGELDLSLLLGKRARLIGSTLRALSLDEKANVVARFTDSFSRALEEKKIGPVVHQVFPATDIVAAQQMMENNENSGKIVMTWAQLAASTPLNRG